MFAIGQKSTFEALSPDVIKIKRQTFDPPSRKFKILFASFI